ncbi:MAG TPA: winged helix-turn-helix domain-containing protein [Vicinamibacterales bacterium]|jgi:DNA-binding winged helix-turn-helix (wHTH) protein/Tfp pilus assembly protein PilF
MVDRPDRFVFPPFELDIRNYELRRDGVVVKVPPQPFSALALLVRRAGTLVTRDELRAEIWGDDRHVDFDGGLNFCIAQLRELLSDPAAKSSYIVAVPRRGYRFVAEVQAVDGGRDVNRWWSWRLSRAAVAVVAVIAAVAIVFAMRTGMSRAVVDLPSVAAVQRYERGASGLADASPRELQDRVTFFEEAIHEAPGYAEAYAGLAAAHLILGNYRAVAPQEAYSSAKAAAARALSLRPDLGDAHAAYAAAIMYFDWDWIGAGDHLERAVALAPSSATTHYWFARYLSATGKHDRALEHARKTVELTPTSPSAHTLLGMTAFYAGRFDEAQSECESAAALMREFEPAHMCRRAVLAERESEPGFWRARLGRLLDSASEEDCVLNAVAIASAQAHMGDHAAALEWLERAANYRSDALVFAAVHPALQRLRSEQRYARVLQRIGLG